MGEDWRCPHCGQPEEPETPVDRVKAWCVAAVVEYQRGTVYHDVACSILTRQDACGDDYHQQHKTMEGDIHALREMADILEKRWKGES